MRREQCISLILAITWLSSSLLIIGAEPEVLGPDKWPENIDVAADMFISRLPSKDQELIRVTKKNDLVQYHHGWGTSIRNEYGLWRGNQKLIMSACGGNLCHPDDASMNIIETVWQRLQK
ncbi:DUF6794 domain-containing protein [Chitinimonas sp. BJYL2]|uniref:DUF6794 domain-containing protein n=1 Tax=Chitinimonas sp. BJYL2 TaxID=2976696 RepID=UPI0022B48E74|nr:DUF6794 domain-containing protein [Chitinimonas sp. BJYL2]